MGAEFKVGSLEDMCSLMCDNYIPEKKLCDTCIYRNENEYHKPCIVYRDDCKYYKSDSEYEIWNGYHGQTIQPKGTFDKIWEDAKENGGEI